MFVDDYWRNASRSFISKKYAVCIYLIVLQVLQIVFAKNVLPELQWKYLVQAKNYLKLKKNCVF